MNIIKAKARHLRKKENSGFSLIEILIVITLIGLIGTFAIQNFIARQEEGKRRGAKILIQQIQTALSDYYRTCSNYPTLAQGGLDALTTKPADNSCKDYDPSGYLKKVPLDPWNNPFVYDSADGRKFILKSLGADRREGGEGNDKDISTEDPDF